MPVKSAVRHTANAVRRPIRLLGWSAFAGVGASALLLILAALFPVDSFLRVGLARFGLTVGLIGSIAFVVWGIAVSLRLAFHHADLDHPPSDALDVLDQTLNERDRRR